MRFLPLVLLILLVPLAFVRTAEPPEGSAAVSATAADGSRPQATDDLERILPEEAALVLLTADWDTIRERCAESEWVRFLADERVGGGFRELVGMLAAGAPPGLPELGPLQAAVHGGAAFFLLPARGGGFSGGLLLQPEGDEGVVEDALRRLAGMLQGKATLTRERYADVDLLRVEQPGEDEVVVAFSTRQLVAVLFGPDALTVDELAHQTIDRRLGIDERRSFATGRLRRSAPERVLEPAFAFHLDVQRLLDAARPGWRRSAEVRALEQVGLSRIAWVHGLADVGAGEELELALSLHVPEGALLDGLADAFGPLPTELLERFPERSLGVGFANYDVAEAFDAVQAFLGEHHPADLEQLRAGLRLAGAQLGCDLEQDLIAQLTGRFGSFTMRVPEGELSPLATMAGLGEAAQGGVYLIELRDPAPVERVIDRMLLFAELADEVEEQRFEEHAVHSLDFDGLFALHWAFTDQGLLVSEFESALVAALLTGEDNAARATRFREGLQALTGASAASLVETESSVAAFLALARAWLVGPGAGAVPLPLPPLPDPSVAEEFFDGTLIFTVERADDRLDFRFRAR